MYDPLFSLCYRGITMSELTEDQRQRFEDTLTKMEAVTELHHQFIHSPVGETVPTQSGPLKTLATLEHDVDMLGAGFSEFTLEIAAHLDTLAPVEG